MARYVALLRGINVGGKNLIPMPALKAAFEEHGFEEVRTYIQSGNVAVLGAVIEPGGAERADRADALDSVRPLSRERRPSEPEPDALGRPNVLREGSAASRRSIATTYFPEVAAHAEGGGRWRRRRRKAWTGSGPGSGVVYFSRLTSRATSSRLNRVASLPIYQQMTIRNWNTTTKLAELVDAKDR